MSHSLNWLHAGLVERRCCSDPFIGGGFRNRPWDWFINSVLNSTWFRLRCLAFSNLYHKGDSISIVCFYLLILVALTESLKKQENWCSL